MFTIQELFVLRQLINYAVQAKGMEVAEASVVLDKKLADMARELEQKTKEEVKEGK